MPRLYSNVVRPSANKAMAPGQEKKGGNKPPAPPKDDEKKGEGSAK